MAIEKNSLVEKFFEKEILWYHNGGVVPKEFFEKAMSNSKKRKSTLRGDLGALSLSSKSNKNVSARKVAPVRKIPVRGGRN